MAITAPDESQNIPYNNNDQFDTIEACNKSLIQHGHYNDRVYLMKLSRDDFPDIIDYLASLATTQGYSKIFVKIPEWAAKEFITEGYRKEAAIPRFYDGAIDGYFLSNYLTADRKNVGISTKKQMNRVLNIALKNKDRLKQLSVKSARTVAPLEQKHVDHLATLYRNVFQTYPFPIFDRGYIEQKMKEDTQFYGVFHGDQLIAASSAEIDYDSCNVELTDFATLPAYRGSNLSYTLLRQMESDMKQMKIKTGYTIARSLSFGMNITFCRMGYSYAGTLVNNTCISGDIESMNVYYKHFMG
jgi:putative beta-lysine N-acetyltransferase